MEPLELLKANATAFCNDTKPELMIVVLCDVSPLCVGFSHKLT